MSSSSSSSSWSSIGRASIGARLYAARARCKHRGEITNGRFEVDDEEAENEDEDEDDEDEDDDEKKDDDDDGDEKKDEDEPAGWRYDRAMPRFVLLHHETPPGYVRPTHYDLMLEWGQSLRTWALAELPRAGGAIVSAEELAPHRLAYLEYEGEVSAGRGRVTRWAAGEFCVLDEKPGFLRLTIVSPTLTGTLEMARKSPASKAWTAVLTVTMESADGGD